MLFNSLEFLIFFPVVTIIYFLLPHKLRWLHLLISSCIFYMAFIPIYILILIFTIVIDYIAGIVIEKSEGHTRKVFLALSIVANVGVLAFFKYYNFLALNFNQLFSTVHLQDTSIPLLNIILPIGLSFHTFQAMSYTIEVYRGNQRAEKHFGIYALYVMFYPQLVAGPIERPQNMLHQFYEKHQFSYENVTSGMRLMLWGLFKKVVIADRLNLLTGQVFHRPHDYPPVTLLIAVFFFTFQIFCDFSGYSDIALGAARVMGFKLMVNFRRPYHAHSVSEFWTRWHISLSSWFRDYLYIPLGGNRVSIPRWYFNLFFVFLVSGLWHGANWTFIAWGALHGFYLIFALLTVKPKVHLLTMFNISPDSKIYGGFQMLTTFLLVLVAWTFFRANNISDAVYIIRQFPAGIHDFLHNLRVHNFWLGHIRPVIEPVELVYCLLLIAFLEAIHFMQDRVSLEGLIKKQPLLIRWSVYYAFIAAILGWGVFTNQSFIYFQF